LGILAGVLFMALGAEAASFGSSAAGTTAAGFLDFGAGARAIGLGGAYSAAADEASALYWNPAAMTQVPYRSAALMHAAYIASSFYDYGSYVQNTGQYGAFGLGLQYYSFGSVTETDVNFNPVGTVSPYDLAASAGYAYRLEDDFAFGLAGKYIQSKWVDAAHTEALDLGLLSPRIIDNRLRLALTAQNLGGTLKYDQVAEPLPTTFKAGAAFHITSLWLADLDVAAPKGGSPYFNLGTEYVLAAGDSWRFAGRAGFSSQNDAPAIGIGVGCGGISVDYAFVPYNDLGDVHRISLTLNFGDGQVISRQPATAAFRRSKDSAVFEQPVPALAQIVNVNPSSTTATMQDIVDIRRQLDLQVMCLRSRCARPGVVALAKSVKTLAGICVEAGADVRRVARRLKDDGVALGATDQNFQTALLSLQEQITQGRSARPGIGKIFRQAQLSLAQAAGCLGRLGGQTDLPQDMASVAICHEKARVGFSGFRAALAAVQGQRQGGGAFFSKLIQTAQSKIITAAPDVARQYSAASGLLAEANERYEHGLATMLHSFSFKDSAMSQAQVSNCANMRRSVAYYLGRMPAIRAGIRAVVPLALPESGEAIRDIDAATSRLKRAEGEWSKAVAALDKESSELAAAMASRDTVEALGYLARAQDLLLAIIARSTGSEPTPLSPQDPSRCDSLY
jgi:hypothetical protein